MHKIMMIRIISKSNTYIFVEKMFSVALDFHRHLGSGKYFRYVLWQCLEITIALVQWYGFLVPKNDWSFSSLRFLYLKIGAKIQSVQNARKIWDAMLCESSISIENQNWIASYILKFRINFMSTYLNEECADKLKMDSAPDSKNKRMSSPRSGNIAVHE